jgi:UDP-glucose 4-epimerase
VNDKCILITGGLGYIGSHAVVQFSKAYNKIIVVDNLINSDISVFEKIKGLVASNFIFYQGDICDNTFLRNIFSKHQIDLVVHFAALKSVPDSINNPSLYYQNNVQGTLNLLKTMNEFKVNKLLFSSSAAIYSPDNVFPVDELAKIGFQNPYAETKILCENLIKNFYKKNNNNSFGILRYFNPLGCHSSGLLGDRLTSHATNVMPMILNSLNHNKVFNIFGKNYQTRDGTASRDYIHVEDLVDAHILIAKKILESKNIFIYNVGLGKDVTVKELVDTFNDTNQTSIEINYSINRPGDLAICFADTRKINDQLGWKPKKTLQDMCSDSFNFYNKNLLK